MPFCRYLAATVAALSMSIPALAQPRQIKVLIFVRHGRRLGRDGIRAHHFRASGAVRDWAESVDGRRERRDCRGQGGRRHRDRRGRRSWLRQQPGAGRLREPAPVAGQNDRPRAVLRHLYGQLRSVLRRHRGHRHARRRREPRGVPVAHLHVRGQRVQGEWRPGQRDDDPGHGRRAPQDPVDHGERRRPAREGSAQEPALGQVRCRQARGEPRQGRAVRAG